LNQLNEASQNNEKLVNDIKLLQQRFEESQDALQISNQKFSEIVKEKNETLEQTQK